ncbi:MAG: diaminopimelate epimerase [Bacteroidota bacterium]
MPFYKYQGTGNDFIMIDDRQLQFPVTNQAYVAQLCDRRFGIGADGLILLQPHTELGFFMKYYNADGNESSMCGNGGRCIAAFSAQLGVASETTKFMAVDGPHDAIIGTLEKNSRFVKLKMKAVDAVDKRMSNTFVLNTGSPHYVQFSEDNLLEMDVVMEAKKIRYNDEFAAQGINVNFISVTGDTSIAIRTYERGVEDETLSCGTGVTAAAISLCLLKKLPSGHYIISVKVMGGDLKVSYDYDENTHSFSNIWLQGPATFVYEGAIEV